MQEEPVIPAEVHTRQRVEEVQAVQVVRQLVVEMLVVLAVRDYQMQLQESHNFMRVAEEVLLKMPYLLHPQQEGQELVGKEK